MSGCHFYLNSKEVNSYQPTKKLELLLLPLLYEVQEEYLGDDKSLISFKAKETESSGIGETSNGLLVHRTAQNYIMRRRSKSPDLPLDHPDRAGLRRINEYLKNVTYALKAPVRRIYSNEDPMCKEVGFIRISKGFLTVVQGSELIPSETVNQ